MLFCKSRQAVRTPRPTQSNQFAPLVATALALLLAWLPLTTAQAEFGDQSLGWTREQEAAVAGYLQRRLQGQGVVINDVWVEYWLAERAGRLRQASSASLGPLSLVLIDDHSFNAFALPGNVMGFHLGLWQTARTEAEFVSVMAHELAHLSLRHFNRLNESNRRRTWLALSGALLGIALATTVDSDVGGATFAGSQAGALQQGLSFSRSMETEADRLSSELLGEVGYDPAAGAAVFQRLQQQVAFNPDASEYWQTHPMPSSRVSRLEGAGAETTDNGDESQPNHQFPVLRWYINRTYLPDDDFSQRPEPLDLPAPESGETLPAGLVAAADPNLIQGWILHRHDDPGRTIERLRALTALFPDFDPAWYQLALRTRDLDRQDAGHCRRAVGYLDEIDSTYLQVLELKQSLAESCQPERQAEATALWLWHRGEESRAMQLLRRSIENPVSAGQVARLRELLTQFENQLSLLPQ